MNTETSGTNGSAGRRARPHPARRARKIAGAVTVASMLALTGGLAATTRRTTSTPTATATNTSASESDDGVVTIQRTLSTSAVAGTASAQANTSSHAS